MRRLLLSASVVLLLAAACNKTVPSIAIDGQTSYELSSNPVKLNIRVKASVPDWNYDLGGAPWLTSYSKTESLLSLSVEGNDSPEQRETVISLYFSSIDEAGVAKVTVIQKGIDVEPFISSEGSVRIAAAGESVDIAVNTNQSGWEYDIIGGADWIVASKASNALRLAIPANPTDLERSGRIRLYAPTKDLALAYSDIAVTQEPSIIDYDPVDLSAEGSSNCYLITHRGEYSFDATVRGNGKGVSGLPAPAALAPAGAKLLWQTVKGMVTGVSYSGGRISFEASKAFGSAVIAAVNASGDIIWSWHIWHPSIEIEALKASSGGEMMNLNLGALDTVEDNVSSYGMLYQWGRKDPFPYSPVPHNGSIATVNIPVYDADGNQVKIKNSDRYSSGENTIAYSIAHPDVCITNNYHYATTRDWLIPAESNLSLWGNPNGTDRSSNGRYLNTGDKSFYDPCPVGWRVPPVRDYAGFTESGGYTWATGDTREGFEFSDLGGIAEVAVVDYDGDGKYTESDFLSGWWFWLNKSEEVKSYFPAATRYDGQYGMLMGSMVGLWGNYWTNTASDDAATGTAIALSFSLKDYNQNYQITISPVSNGSRADAYSVRCIKE